LPKKRTNSALTKQLTEQGYDYCFTAKTCCSTIQDGNCSIPPNAAKAKTNIKTPENKTAEMTLFIWKNEKQGTIFTTMIGIMVIVLVMVVTFHILKATYRPEAAERKSPLKIHSSNQKHTSNNAGHCKIRRIPCNDGKQDTTSHLTE